MPKSPRLSHGIHVNPKYVEARCHSENSLLDNEKQPSRVASSPLRSYGHLDLPNDEYDLDSSDALKAEVRTVTSTGQLGHTSQGGLLRETLHVDPYYKQGRATERDRGASEWWRKHSFDRIYPKLDSSSAYNERSNPRALIDAYGKDRGRDNKANWQDAPKALIDAYGNERGTNRQPHWHDNQLAVVRLQKIIINYKMDYKVVEKYRRGV